MGPYRSEKPILPPRAMVSSRPGLLLGVMPGSVALPHLWSVLMSMAPVTIESNKGSAQCAAQTWSCPSLTPHQLQHLGEWALKLPKAAQ